MNLIVWLVIGGVVGWLASIIMKRDASQGVFLNIVVGIIGALLGGWLFSTMGVSAGGGLLGAIVVALIGAIILIFLLRLIKRA